MHPRLAVISVGRHNTFGHPAPATLEAWRHSGADVRQIAAPGSLGKPEFVANAIVGQVRVSIQLRDAFRDEFVPAGPIAMLLL